MATYTDAEVQAYIESLRNQGLSGAELDKAIYDAAKQYDVSASQVERAISAKAGSSTKWLQDQGLTQDWASDLVARGDDASSAEAFQLALDTGMTIPDAIKVMQGAGLTDPEGSLAYMIDAFGRDKMNDQWLSVGSLFGTTGDPFNFPYQTDMMADLHGGLFDEQAYPSINWYANRYGMGADDLSNWASDYTGQYISPKQINQAIFDYGLDPLVGSEQFTPTPNITNYNTPNYAAYDRKQGESLTQYYDRLYAQREGGILGTRGFAESMFNTPTVGSEAYQDIKNAEVMNNIMSDPAVVAAITGGSSYVPNVEDGTAIDWNDFIETDIGKWINSKLGGSDIGGYVYGDPWSTVNPYDPTEGLFTDSTNTGGGSSSSSKTQPAGTKDTNYGGMDIV